MGKLIISQIGGSGGDLDMITATSSDVIKDKVIVGKDGEPIVGSLELVGTADPSYVLAGKTFYNTDAKVIQTGTMAVQSAISFSAAAASATAITIRWTNPSVGPWEGVEIRRSSSGYPGVSGGTLIYKGPGGNPTPGGQNYAGITGMSAGSTWYFTCTNYATGLGYGTSHNVSATTNGLIVYDNGYNPYSITAYGTKPSIQSTYLNIAEGDDYNKNSSQAFRSSTAIPVANPSSYTYLCVQFTGYLSSSTYLSFVFNDNFGKRCSVYPWGVAVDTSVMNGNKTSLTTLKCKLSSYATQWSTHYANYGYPKLQMQLYNYQAQQSGDNSFYYNQFKALKIYKIWFE